MRFDLDVCAHFRDLCSNEVHTGLYLVRAKSLKERMEAAAGNTARKLLDQIQSMARDSNDHVCSTYASMATVVSLVRLSIIRPTSLQRLGQYTCDCCGQLGQPSP